jgi:hypothetical protein
MRQRILTLALLAAAIAPAHATIVDLQADGQWNSFVVDNLVAPSFGNGWVDYTDGSALSFSFTIAAGQVGTLTIVDSVFAGDIYAITNNGSLLGSTSSVAVGDLNGPIVFDYASALADSSFSRGVFTLAAGTYNIGGYMTQSVLDNGAPLYASEGGISLSVTPVPEPESYALLLAGLGLTTVVTRRLKKQNRG